MVPGGGYLLTDPQILTDSKLGLIFAEGNLQSGFSGFEKDHKCNKFCEFFQLPTDYAEWDIGDLIESEPIPNSVHASYPESQHNEEPLFLNGPDSHGSKVMSISRSRA